MLTYLILLKSKFSPQLFVSNTCNLCVTSAFGDEPRRMLRIIQRLGKHCSCHLQGERVMVGRFRQGGSGWCVGFDGPSRENLWTITCNLWSLSSAVDHTSEATDEHGLLNRNLLPHAALQDGSACFNTLCADQSEDLIKICNFSLSLHHSFPRYTELPWTCDREI
jgi:hypothetical protein